MTSQSNILPGHLAPLTSLRFIAALFIYIHHLWGKFDIPHISAYGLYFGVGVPFFFALSGFILSYKYPPPSNLSESARMILYRIARIWPLHAACLLIFIILLGDFDHPLQNPKMILPNILLIQSWLGMFPYSFSFNAVSWSLSNELFFYILFPFFLGMTNRSLIIVACASSFVAMMWATASWEAGTRIVNPVVSGLAITVTHPLSSLPIFIAGIFTARAFRRYRDRFENIHLVNVLEIVAVCLFVIYMVFNREISAAVNSTIGANAPVSRWVLPILGIAAFVPAIFIFAVGRGLISTILSSSPLVFLGNISFSFYLVHQPIINYLNNTTSLKSPEGIIASLGLSIIISVVLFKAVELPAQRMLRGLVDGALKPAQLPVQPRHLS